MVDSQTRERARKRTGSACFLAGASGDYRQRVVYFSCIPHSKRPLQVTNAECKRPNYCQPRLFPSFQTNVVPPIGFNPGTPAAANIAAGSFFIFIIRESALLRFCSSPLLLIIHVNHSSGYMPIRHKVMANLFGKLDNGQHRQKRNRGRIIRLVNN